MDYCPTDVGKESPVKVTTSVKSGGELATPADFVKYDRLLGLKNLPG
jgi:hypothetical protein